ncbi:VIT domain-containing protein [Nannocystis punicea]|uniref:VIT domain-containing protein n=1 Tax=Nannocystis punicea TaxID=2995304 RepID=A0ABY7H7D1_9BACT|nr:VIT domain-containing protein [Nannocystis poenicansa]WAS94939.1 VIT domain-containing protein [Nannocystis poenicansa]
MRRHIPLVVCLGLAGLVACTGRQGPSDSTSSSQPQSTGECKLEWRAPDPQPSAGVAPFSLTTQDGTGLKLLSVKSRAVVEDPLAFTELHLAFQNPNDRVIEGRFEINLPPNSAISRFAMLIDGRWQEAEVVELQAARQAYEDFLHRRQDPALLEKSAGNRFSARVFPIPARGVKEIIVSYSEELTSSSEPYRVYLRGLPQLQDLDVEVVVPKGGGVREKTRIHETNFMPQQDLELATSRRAPEVGLRYDRLAVARITPDVKLPQVPVTGVTLLFDTSASRALDFKGQVARLGQLVAELRGAAGVDFPLTVACFDQGVEQVFSGNASSFSADAQNAILKRGALGASDLAGALRWAGAQSKVHDRVILVGDGVATAGGIERDVLRTAVQELGRAGVRRLDAVVDGGLRDEAALRQLTTAGLQDAGILVDARLPAPLVASRLVRATKADVKVHVPGATWVWPQSLGAVQPGDQFLVFADLPVDKPMRVELGERGEDVREVSLGESSRPLLERAWIRASIDRLSAMMGHEAAGDAKAKEDLKQQIIGLSTRYRVLSDYTALLVLETDWDYQRFGIDRTALAEILTVGPDGVAVVDRTRLPDKPVVDQPITPEQPVARDGEADDDGPLDWFFGNEKRKNKKEATATVTAAANAEPAAEAKSEAMPLPKPADMRAKGDRGGNDLELERGPVFEQTIGGAPGAAAGPQPNDPFASPPRDEAASDRPAHAAPPPPPGPPPAEPAPPSRIAAAQEEVAAPDAVMREVEGYLAEDARRPATTRAAHRPPGHDHEAPPWNQMPQPTFEQPKQADAWEGRFADVMFEVRAGRAANGLSKAWEWRDSNPGDELALLGLGEAAEAVGDRALAARAYGSLIDLFPGRTDIRRMAGERLESLGDVGLQLAIDTYAQAVSQRPDHPASHRLYAFALLKAGRHAEAFAAALAGARRSYPSGRFAGVQQILEEDLALIAAAWLTARPGDAAAQSAIAAAGVTPDRSPSLRFVLNWETDANDVDFHIYDGKGGHAFFSQKQLPTGGRLYADVTTGYGPECFTIPGNAAAFPYVLQAHYYSRGPMGYGMGKLQAVQHDGKGGLAFMEHPFVIMKDRAYVDLGRVDRPLSELQVVVPRLPSGPDPKGQPYAPYTPPPPAPPPPSRY